MSDGRTHQGQHPDIQVSAPAANTQESQDDDSEGFIAAYAQTLWRERSQASGALSTVSGHCSTRRGPWWVVDEDAKWRLLWDVLSVLLTVVLVLCEPWIAAFQPRSLGFGLRQIRRHEAWVAVLDAVNIVWFSFDILLSMATTYRTVHGVKVWDPRRIAKKYLLTFFTWDLLATVPCERIVAKRICRKRCARKGAAITLLHMVSIARSFRGSKIARANQLARQLTFDPVDIIGLPPAAGQIARFLLGAFMGMHVFACVWYLIGDRSKDRGLDEECYDGLPWSRREKAAQCTWTQRGGYSRSVLSTSYLYLTSLYWAVTTVTTVGYGDISANTVGEKLFTIFVEVAGVSWFATLISAVGTEVMSDSRSDEVRRLKLALKKFLYRHDFPAHLAQAVIAYVRNQFEVEREFDGDDPEVSRLLRESLNDTLKRHVALHMASRDPLLRRNAFFIGHDQFTPRRSSIIGGSLSLFSTLRTRMSFDWGPHKQFVADCVLRMKISIAGPGELLVARNSKASALHMVARGRVIARSDHDDSKDLLEPECEPPTFCVEAGDYFGDESVLLAVLWAIPLCTPQMYCEFIVIDVQHLAELFEAHPDVAEERRSFAYERVRKHPSVFVLEVSANAARTDGDCIEDVAVTSRARKPNSAFARSGSSLSSEDAQAHLKSISDQIDLLRNNVALLATELQCRT